MNLKVTAERKSIVELLHDGNRGDTHLDRQNGSISQSIFEESTEDIRSSDLHLQFNLENSEMVCNDNYLRFGYDKIHRDNHSHTDVPMTGNFISGKRRAPRQDATRLGDLRRRKQGHHLVDALKILEPRLEALEENSIAGYPMIWGDVGLPELVPLSGMGEGMTHVARIFLAIFATATTGGVVMVDEIENGIHYSVLEKVWRAIGEAAERIGVQFFATTHSFECMEAAHDALGNKLVVHRIEEDREGKSRCVTLDAEGIAAVIRHGFEVR